MLNRKIKAGVLQYVLVISVIITIIILAFISLIYLQQRVSIKQQLSKKAIENTLSGFNYLKRNKIEYDKLQNLDFLKSKNSYTQVKKKHWGVFDVVRVKSIVGKESFEKLALVGVNNVAREALYLKDNNQSMVLVGATKIHGKVFLPKSGVKRGNIAGNSYKGNQLIYGDIITSSSKLPYIKKIDHLDHFINRFKWTSFINFDLNESLKLENSFSKRTLLYEDNQTIIISNTSLNGNIVLFSKKKIIVKSTTLLKNVILIAPVIVIESNFKGSIQAIASNSIHINKNCKLQYPSALIVLDKNKSSVNINNQDGFNQIKIEDNVIIKGVVLYQSDNESINYKSQIFIGEKAKVTGEVYCSNNLEMLGRVNGSVYTNNFIVKKSGGIFVNHLYNAVISSKDIPKQYAGLDFGKGVTTVAKWVD